MKKSLITTYRFFNRRRRLFYTLTASLFIVFAALSTRIKIEEDISHMIPNGEKTRQINQIFSHSGFADKIVIKISGKANAQPEDLIAIADSFESKLQSDYKNYISEIRIRVNDQTAFDIYRTVHNNLPIYLAEGDYKTIDTLITPQHIQLALETDYKILTSPSGLVLKQIVVDDPVGISAIVLKRLQSLQLDENFDLYDGYIMTKDRKNLVLFITPANPPVETAKNGHLIDGLDKIAKDINTSQSKAEVFYFGGVAVAVGNARQSRQDTILTLSITVVALLLFIGFFFRRKRTPVIMMLPVVFGALFSLAVITIFKGSISVIALAAGSVILGIAVNYSLHFFSHYRHCGFIEQTIEDLLVPLTLGSFTTVGSFFSLTLLKSQILSDFGLFAGFSLVGATIFTLIFLPHFVPLQTERDTAAANNTWLDKMPALPIKVNAALVILIFLATIFLFPYATRVGFESDITKLNFMTKDLKRSEAEIEQLRRDSSTTVYIASSGNNLQQALQNNENLLQKLDSSELKGWVKKYSSINHFILSDKLQQERLKRWNEYWTEAKKQQLTANVLSESSKYKFKASAFVRFDSLLNRKYGIAGDSDFAAIKNTFGREFFVSSEHMETIINAVNINEAMRPSLYKSLQSEASVTILDKKVITNKFIDIIYSDFNSILIYSSILVFVSLLFSYGRLELTIITFLPMLISWIWILGIMTLLELKFNIISIIISTFIFGLGDDFSIFITDGLTQKFKEGKELLASHKISIYLSAGTTIIGLGALIFAQHPAIHSIALISIIGISCVLLIGQTIQPFLYNFFIQSRKERGFAPWTFATFFLSAFAYAYFAVGALVTAAIGYFIIYALPYPQRKTRKQVYHYLISKFISSLVYIMINTRKVTINKELMDFSKPAIIICNHQSVLDILVTVMQNPKLILLTNRWVYHSPVFGKVVQLAEYYPVMEGVEPAIDKFEKIVQEGYSIVIFPEGTRAADGNMKRFHKGAFYLAEKLGLDVVPLLLHGTGDTMKKSDFMLFDGTVTMKYLPRILQADKFFGEGYAARTKNIARYFKQEYKKLRSKVESPAYFRQRLIANYMYKGPYLELYPRLEMRNAKEFGVINKIIPDTANITVLGCGYGLLNYLLYFLSESRIIAGIDEDEEKIAVANNCYSKTEQLHFNCSAITNYAFGNSDAIIVNGILHNLSYEEQRSFLSKLAGKLNPRGLIIIRKFDSEIEKIEGLTTEIVKIDGTHNSLFLLRKV